MIVALGAATAVAILVLALGVPGYAVGRLFNATARGADRLAISLICSFSVVPLGYFMVAVGAGIPIERPLIGLLAFVVTAGAFVARKPERPLVARDGRQSLLGLALCALFATALVALTIRALDGGDVFATLQHCLYVIVMHSIGNHPSDAVALYDHLSGEPMHVLVHHTTQGFSGLAPLFHEQRLGNAAIMAPHVALVGSAGWYTVCIHAYLVIMVTVFAASKRAGANAWAATVGSAILMVGLQTICGYTVNENMFAVALVGFLIWACLDSSPPRAMVILVGLVAGHLVGVRHTSVLFWPAVAIALWWGPGARWRRLAVAGAAATLTVLPWLYVNLIMLGNPLGHPKVINDSDGRVVTNSLFGVDFTFKALNWPFTTSVVRTAWNPFPTFLWLPLLAARAFGVISLAIGALGIRQSKRNTWLLLMFFVPHCAAMMWLELLDWEQISYATPGLTPIGIWLAVGLTRLVEPETWRKRAGLVVALSGVLVLGTWAVGNARFAVDMRGLDPVDHPNPPAEDAGVVAVRDALTGVHLLPRLPVTRGVVAAQFAGALGSVIGSTGRIPTKTLPAYPSGQVGILTGYAESGPRRYEFGVVGRTARTTDTPIRTGVSLHAVSVQLAAKRIDVAVSREQGRYDVAMSIVEPSDTLADFTFYISPWRPFLRAMTVTVDGAALPNLRVLNYAGRLDEGEAVFLASNYPDEIVGLRTITLTIDPGAEVPHCGWIIFGIGHDFSRIETTVLGGGHVQSWNGDLEVTLTLPSAIVADRVLVFSEPYCSSHVPQYGDRYGVFTLPPGNRATVTLDQQWLEAPVF